jgi:uncharacterized protein YraI
MPQPNRTLLVLLGLFACADVARAEPAVLDRKLNLRAGPGAAFATIAVMPPGARLEVQRCAGEWCRVTYRRWSGYASRHYLDAGRQPYAAAGPIPAPPPEDAEPSEKAPLIWRWRERKSRDRHWRDIEFNNRHRR